MLSLLLMPFLFFSEILLGLVFLSLLLGFLSMGVYYSLDRIEYILLLYIFCCYAGILLLFYLIILFVIIIVLL